MNPFNQGEFGGTELSPKQLHAIRQNTDGQLEFSTNKALSNDELIAIDRIKHLLDRLQFESED
jgi:hypothetical protein